MEATACVMYHAVVSTLLINLITGCFDTNPP